jgi:hypothetical protein
MKKVRINKIILGDKNSLLTRNKLNSIHLGNGLTCYFSNLKEAKSYIVKTNSFLQLKLLELNKIYIDTWVEYRNLYVYHYDIIGNNVKIESNLIALEKSINLIVERSNWENGNHFTFSHFYKLIDCLLEFIKLVIKYFKAKRIYNSIFHFEIYQERVQFIRQTINNWGIELQHKTPNAFYDLGSRQELEKRILEYKSLNPSVEQPQIKANVRQKSKKSKA